MTDDQRQDAAFILDVLKPYQQSSGHGELIVKIQDGRVVMITETKKHKPR
jgi:hypothetical protein